MTPLRAFRAPVAAAAVVLALVLVTACDGSHGAAPGGGPTASTPPGSVAAFCAPYVQMRQALEALDYRGDPDRIAAEMAPVMRAWAEQVPDLERPPGIADDVWVGLRLLAKRILRLPLRPSRRQLDAVEGDLTRDEQRLITEASDWFAANCDLGATSSAPWR
jgi:hypothetical protein